MVIYINVVKFIKTKIVNFNFTAPRKLLFVFLSLSFFFVLVPNPLRTPVLMQTNPAVLGLQESPTMTGLAFIIVCQLSHLPAVVVSVNNLESAGLVQIPAAGTV